MLALRSWEHTPTRVSWTAQRLESSIPEAANEVSDVFPVKLSDKQAAHLSHLK
jgi:hypothetical protein